MGKELENRLLDSMKIRHQQINPEKLEDIILQARAEFYEKKGRERITYRTFLLRQIKFLGWKIWLIQGLVLVALCSAIAVSFGEHAFRSQRYTALLLCCLAVLVSMTAIPFIYRARHFKMHEIEAAARFSSVRQLLAKLLILGIGDGIMLGAMLLVTVWQSSMGAGSAVLYLMMPFLLAGSGCLYFLGHTSAEKFPVCCIGMCVLMLLLAIWLNRFLPGFFQQTFSAGWMCVCGGLLLFCLHQFRYLSCHSSFAEMQLS